MEKQINNWIETAVSKIVSPEKKKEARSKLESEIRLLLMNDDCENVLQKLGDANLVAEQLLEEYSLKSNSSKYKKVGILLLMLSVISFAYAFVTLSRQSPELSFGGMNNFSTMFATGNGIAGGFVCGIVFLILGIMLIRTVKG